MPPLIKRFELILGPMDNNLYSTLRNGRRIKTAEAKWWKHAATLRLRGQGLKPVEGFKFWGVQSVVVVGKGQHHTFDLANCYKLFIDAMAMAIGIDDRYLISETRHKVFVPGKCEAVIRGAVMFWESLEARNETIMGDASDPDPIPGIPLSRGPRRAAPRGT